MKRTLLLTSLIGLSTFASAEVIEGVGTGKTAEIAKQNAIDNAVKASVGEFLVSKEELNNDSVIQKILSYSNAHMKNIETKSEELKDGAYQVTVSIDFESSKLVDKLKEAEPTISFVAKTPETKPTTGNATPDESNEMSFEQLVYSLLIEPALSKATFPEQIVEFELLSPPVEVEVKNKKEDGSTTFELPFRWSMNKEYTKSVRKVFLALKDKDGSKFSLEKFDIAKGIYSKSILNTILANQEKLESLNQMLGAIPVKGELRLILDEKDGTELVSIKQGSNIGEYSVFTRDSFVKDRLVSGYFYPLIEKGMLNFLNGTTEGKITFRLDEEATATLKNGGKIKLQFGY